MNIKKMVDRFLSWTLPSDFSPDCYISFAPTEGGQWPIGTNLLTAEQAQRMFEHVLDGTTTASTAEAMEVVTAALRADADYAWSWQCNVAMAAYDAGCPIGVANEGAARFLQILAGVDTRKHPCFADTQTGHNGLTFGLALESLKRGKKVARAGWNGKGMWACLIHPGDAMHLGFDMQPCFGLKNAAGDMQPGWVPSIGDCLAEDWQVIA